MKGIFFIILTAALLLSGCTKTENNNSIKADDITISYGVSSYAMFGAEQKIIDDLLNQFNALSFEKTTDKMDLTSAFSVIFSCNGKSVKSFRVDKNGVFWIDGETQCYKIFSGLFSYDHLKAIYENSKNINYETSLPVLSPEKITDKGIDVIFQKEIFKNKLLIMIDEMTRPTQENPDLAFSSNPYDYIESHKDIFNQLVSYKQSTIAVFVDILKNSNEYGLDKYIMAAVCAEITGIGNGDDKTWSSAKEWLKLYEESGGKS